MKNLHPFSWQMRLLHWSIVGLFLVLAYTETMNMIFFSKEAILKSFEFSFAALGYQDIPPLDRLFIARLERREGWMWHYYAGIGFTVLSSIRFALFIVNTKRRYHWLHITLFVLIATLAATGYSLWAYPHVYEWQNTTRVIHYYSVWALYGVIGTHVAWILWLEISGKRAGVISRMIGGVHDGEKKNAH